MRSLGRFVRVGPVTLLAVAIVLPLHAVGGFAVPDANGLCQAPMLAPEYRSYDGTCNNLGTGRADWGSASTPLLRVHGATTYAADGSTPLLSMGPNPRAVSNVVSAQSGSMRNALGISDMLMQWGQFLDHDIDLTPTDRGDPMSIAIPAGDAVFSGQMPFSRSQYDPASGSGTPRQQINAITAFIDASQIYGSDAATADSLRTFSGGKLKMSGPPSAPLLHTEMTLSGPAFVSGDERVNEQAGLTAMHTLFNREHNRLADEMAVRDPGMDDETIYQEVRKVVGGIMQAITYNEFLPVLLGSAAPGDYQGYDPDVNPGIANAFSTAAYRFGHSTLSPALLRIGADGEPVSNGHLPLQDAFFNPSLLSEPGSGGIEAILRGLLRQTGQAVDPFLVDAVRNMLFGPPVDVGFDLAALNIQRGRDHGLPGFNAMREALGLDAYDGWDDAVFLPGVKPLLQAVYDDVDDIDLWIGGLAEAHVNGGMLGEVFSTIVSDQFERLRAGDRFWYENGLFEPDWLDMVESSTLSALIVRNTAITRVQANVFFVPVPSTLALLAAFVLAPRPRRQGDATRQPAPLSV